MTQIPIDVPPFQLQRLISNVIDPHIFERSAESQTGRIHVKCAQALGSDIYVGCSNGDLLRFSLQADDPTKLETYTLLSRQTVPGEKAIDEIVVIPSLSRAFVLSDNQIHFYTIPSLDLYPIKPIRHVITFAVDDHHLKTPAPSANMQQAGIKIPIDPVDFCVVKRSGIAMYTLKDRLIYQKEIPLPQGHGTTLARRAGHSLCIADKAFYNMVDLEGASLIQLLPLSQAFEPTPFVVKPSITVVGPNEFLILSWTGASSLGLFITGEGDPVRGTLEWPSHPEAISLDYPYITSLLPNNTIEIHSVETQAIVQVIGAPPPTVSPTVTSASSPIKRSTHQRDASSGSARSLRGSTAPKAGVDLSKRLQLITTIGGHMVPSTQKIDKMRKVPVKLLRT